MDLDMFFSDFSHIPNILLSDYRSLNISDFQVLIIIHLMAFRSKGIYLPKCEDISLHMEASTDEVRNALAELIEKKLIDIDNSSYKFSPLFKKLNNLKKSPDTQQKTESTSIYEIIEKEFGRPLSPLETGHIKSWTTRHSEELIFEALKIASLRNIYNITYIDRILFNWYKNNICTVREARQYQKKVFSSGKQDTKNNDASYKIDKYKDIYLT